MKLPLIGIAALAAILLFPHAAPAAAQEGGPSRCQINQSALETRTAEINQSYGGRFARLAQRTEEQAKDIEDDAPDVNMAEGGLKIDFIMGSRRQDFSMDLPQITMRSQAYSFDVPQSRMGTETWKYKIPAVRMRMHCIDGPPELVCGWKVRPVGFGITTKIWECSTRKGKQICTEIPETYMQEVETILDVPQVTMVRQEIKTDMPEVTMRTTRMSFDVPTITMKNLSVEQRELEERGTALGEQTKAESDALATSMQTELAKASADAVAEQYACNRTQIEVMRDEKLAEFDSMIKVVTAARDKAAEVGAEAMLVSNNKVLSDLVAARETFQAQMAAALAKMTSSEQGKLDATLAT
jgi:hypothetical protein